MVLVSLNRRIHKINNSHIPTLTWKITLRREWSSKGMQAASHLFERRFFLAFRRALSISCSSQHLLSPTTLRFSTQVTDVSESIKEEEIRYSARTIGGEESTREDKEEAPRSLCGRIEKLERGDPVGSAFQSWMGDGFPIHRGDIFHTINRLRKRKFNKRALEVMHTRCSCKCLTQFPKFLVYFPPVISHLRMYL